MVNAVPIASVLLLVLDRQEGPATVPEILTDTPDGLINSYQSAYMKLKLLIGRKQVASRGKGRERRYALTADGRVEARRIRGALEELVQ